MENITNSTNNNSSVIPPVHTYQIVLGCTTFFLVLPFVLFHVPRYPLGSTGAVLVGAFLMVTCTVVSQTEVYTVIGDPNNLKTIFLLWGMMVISSYFERERLIDRLLDKLFPSRLSFYSWLLRLSIIDSIVAALFTNDVACVILTPLLLKKWIDHKRDKRELDTLLLAIATQANIGSTLTIFGNPQMALMASTSNAFVDPNSRLELKTCVMYLWIPTFVVWSLNLIFLLLHHRFAFRKSKEILPKQSVSEMSTVDQSPSETITVEEPQPEEQPPSSVSMISVELPRFTQRFQRRRCAPISERTPPMTQKVPPSPAMISRSVSVASFANLDELLDKEEDEVQPSQSLLFKIILFTLLIAVIALLFASNDKVYFDIGLVPVGAAILLFVADVLINNQAPLLILSRIDWNVLLLFFGIFVWLDGLNSTGIPHRVWVALNLESASFTDMSSLLLFFAFTLIGSNIFSNVPLTILVLQQVPITGDHLSLILYLAFLTTIAGNLTLFGSVANLIVAQKALASSLKYRFSFWNYFKFGFLTTILFSFVGLFIIYGLVRVMH